MSLSNSAISDMSASPLLSLPDEVLDLVLVRTIASPEHPKSGLRLQESFKDLFIPTLQVNQKLRYHTIDVIVHSTLWITLKVRAPIPGAGRFPWFDDFFPFLNHAERSTLPTSLPGIIFYVNETFGLPTAAHEQTKITYVFPFNMTSMARLGEYVALWGMSPACTLTIPRLPLHSQMILDHQILPILSAFMTHNGTRRTRHNGIQVRLETYHPSVPKATMATNVDTVMGLIQDFDRAGLSLEASLIAFECGDRLTDSYGTYPPIQSSSEWVHNLEDEDYLTQPENLERMRLIRTVHYIEHRACLTYISAAEAYGVQFVKSNISKIIGQGEHCLRWMSTYDKLDSFGIPEHELAELYRMRALMSIHVEKFSKMEAENMFLNFHESEYQAPDYAFSAIKHAYVAWRLDKTNVRYAALFHRVAAQFADLLPILLRDIVPELAGPYRAAREVVVFRYLDFDSQIRVCGGTSDVCCEDAEVDPNTDAYEQIPDYHPLLWRAREVAKRANVTYDTRRGAELTELEYKPVDEKEILADLLEHSDKGLKFDKFGITDRDIEEFNVREAESNPWKKWPLR